MLSMIWSLSQLLDVRGGGLQAGHAVDHVDGEVEAVDLIEDRELERRVDVALLLVAAHVDVVVVVAAIGELVDERGVAVEVEDDRLVEGEERVEVAIGEAVRMLGVGHEAEEIDDVDEANLEVGEASRGGWRRRPALPCVGMSPAQAMTTSGSLPSSVRGPVPDADALGAVR